MEEAEAGAVARRDAIRTPALVALAVVCTLEGYAHLGTIGSTGWVEGSAGMVVFAAVCLGVAAFVTRPALGLRRPHADRLLLEVCGIQSAATIAAVVGGGMLTAQAVGAADLLVALTCLAAATAGERNSLRHVRSRAHPSGLRHH